jgi:outer membrane receptor protein involved in Fe transport
VTADSFDANPQLNNPGAQVTNEKTFSAQNYIDLSANFTIHNNLNFRVGVNNVFDKDPPFFATGSSGTQALDTIPGYYDVFGRAYYAGARMTF